MVALSWRLTPLCMLLLAGCSQPEPELRVQQDELPTCEEPVEQPGSLRDGTTDSAVDFIHSLAGLDPELSRLDGHVVELSAGVVAADLDNDDWIDLFLPQLGGANGLYFWQALHRNGALAYRADKRPYVHSAELGLVFTLLSGPTRARTTVL